MVYIKFPTRHTELLPLDKQSLAPNTQHTCTIYLNFPLSHNKCYFGIHIALLLNRKKALSNLELSLFNKILEEIALKILNML